MNTTAPLLEPSHAQRPRQAAQAPARETRVAMHALYAPPTRAERTQLRAGLCQRLRLQGQEDAAACLERDWEDSVTFFDFPVGTLDPPPAHHQPDREHLRGRPSAHQRFQAEMRVRENALHSVFRLVTRLSMNWRAINGPNQLTLLLAGGRFVDGKRYRNQPNTGALLCIAHLTELRGRIPTTPDKSSRTGVTILPPTTRRRRPRCVTTSRSWVGAGSSLWTHRWAGVWRLDGGRDQLLDGSVLSYGGLNNDQERPPSTVEYTRCAYEHPDLPLVQPENTATAQPWLLSTNEALLT